MGKLNTIRDAGAGGIDHRELNEALEKGCAKWEELYGLRYIRFSDDYKHIPRGTAVFNNITVWGYPHIGRILILQSGITEQFSDPFWVEEKVDGYNVRVFRLGDRILALTRGGFICPFTTDRIPDLLDIALFESLPEIVVCGEMAGPDNPYLSGGTPVIDEDVALLVFDFMRINKTGFLAQHDKMLYIDTYNLPSVNIFGRYDKEALPEIRNIILQLNEEGREGVIFKDDSAANRRAKYVTGRSDISDISLTAQNLLELPPEYFTNRILRLTLFLKEHGLDTNTTLVSKQLGSALLNGLLEAIYQYQMEHKVYHTHRCRFLEHSNAILLVDQLRHIQRQTQIVQRDLHREGKYWVLEFDKIYPTMSGLLGHLLSGGLVFD